MKNRPRIDPGSFDRRVTIEQNTPTRNETGAEVDSWSTFAEPWAKKLYKAGKEFFSGQQLQAEEQVMYQMRYITGVKREMRIVDSGVVYDILNIPERGRRRYLEITAKAHVE